MKYNEYFSEALGLLFIIIPLFLASLKLSQPRVPWWVLTCTCLLLSGIIINLIMWVSPPDNGFATQFSMLFGWFYMLPFFVISSLISWLARRAKGTHTTKCVSYSLFLTTLILPLYASTMHISEKEAREIASTELTERGYPSHHTTQAEKTSDGWIIHTTLSTGDEYPVYLSRSGYVTGMGG